MRTIPANRFPHRFFFCVQNVGIEGYNKGSIKFQ